MHQSLFSRRLKEWKKVELLLLPRRRRGASVAPYAPRYSFSALAQSSLALLFSTQSSIEPS